MRGLKKPNGVETRGLRDRDAIIEAGGGSSNGELLVDIATYQWPTKPVRYFLFSHHHAHSVGGVRAMIAEHATIVMTPGNEPVVRDAAKRCFMRKRDRLGRWDVVPTVELVHGTLELKDTTNHIVAMDIGSNAQVADEFLVFWFPRQKLLFQMEHGWLRRGARLSASEHAKGLLRSIRSRGISPSRFAQGCPVKGLPAELTSAQLQALVRTARR